MISTDALAKAILSQRDDISNKKLQKLAYYSYAWYLTIYGYKLTDIVFEAWEHGPVSRYLYNEYRRYGWNTIPRYRGFLLVPDETLDFIEAVVDYYGDYDADQLEKMTHGEAPWQEARQGYAPSEASDAVISDFSIVNYYSRKAGIRREILAGMR
ncbi:MAG: SocA family protein [Lachnospiraceae bacterium]|jgi:uncharacterized phage-associated protein|nr:SocA family protein [Lachnospiraceae bacterium]